MSNNNQVIPPLSTEEKLEFFIERAEALARYFAENFRNADIGKIGISRNTNIEGDEWKFHTLTYLTLKNTEPINYGKKHQVTYFQTYSLIS